MRIIKEFAKLLAVVSILSTFLVGCATPGSSDRRQVLDAPVLGSWYQGTPYDRNLLKTAVWARVGCSGNAFCKVSR